MGEDGGFHAYYSVTLSGLGLSLFLKKVFFLFSWFCNWFVCLRLQVAKTHIPSSKTINLVVYFAACEAGSAWEERGEAFG